MTQIKLPIPHVAQPKAQPFAPGDAVLLRAAPFGPPGTVQRVERGRVVVKWSDMHYVGKHKAEALLPASAGLSCADKGRIGA